MDQRLSLVTLGVRDLARARAFYEGGLGWRPSSASVEGVVAFYQLGGMALSLWGVDSLAEEAGLEVAPPGRASIALALNLHTREDVDRTLAEAVAAGATLLKPGSEREWGGYTGYFSDPEGHTWEVAWNPHFALDAAGRLKLP